MRQKTIAILILPLSSIGLTIAHASNWTGPVGVEAEWNNVANWDNGIPSSSEGATIANGGIAYLDGNNVGNSTGIVGGSLVLAGNGTGDGTLTLRNGAALTVYNGARIGWGSGNGTLNIESGSSYILEEESPGSGSIFIVGDGPTGYVNVTGAGSKLDFSIVASRQFNIGFNGDGTLTLSEGGAIETALTSNQIITVGGNLGYSGTLNIGGGSADTIGGSISENAVIQNSSGNGYINFNHGNDNYLFSTKIMDSGSGGMLSLTHDGSGTTTITVALTYTGSTKIYSGTLAIDGTNMTNPGDSLIRSTSSIDINATGTLRITGVGDNNRIEDSIDINMNGGSMEINGVTETLGTVNVITDSTLKITSAQDTNLLTISMLNLNGILDIQGWEGDYMIDDGTFQAQSLDRIYVLNLPVNLDDITWSDFSVSGYQVTGTVAYTDGMGTYIIPELSLIPESSSYAILFGAVALGFVASRRKRK